MDSSALLAEAYYLIQQDLYVHLEEAEYLAQEDWTDDQADLARDLLEDLCAIIRRVLAAHRHDSGVCSLCAQQWPCSVVILIHGLVKDPQRHFVGLLESRRNRAGELTAAWSS